MSRFEIAVVSADIDPDVFLKEYYEPRQPVLIRGIPIDPGLHDVLTPENLKQVLLEEKTEDVQQNRLWWDVNDKFLNKFSGKLEQPSLLKTVQEKINPNLSKKPWRFWASSKDTLTPWHYDGHSIDVFNLQVIGSKKFALLDPNTPLPCVRFKPYSTTFLAPPDDEVNHWTEVETHPGDLIFVPRHWFHKVASLGDWNINMNWTWFDPNLPLDTKTSEREIEITALLYYLARVLDKVPRRLLPVNLQGSIEYVKYYGASDKPFVVARDLIKHTTFAQLWRRYREEIKAIPYEQIYASVGEEEKTLNQGVRRSADDYWRKQAI